MVDLLLHMKLLSCVTLLPLKVIKKKELLLI